MKHLMFIFLIGLPMEFVSGQDKLGPDCLDIVSVQSSRWDFFYPGANYVTIALPGISMDSCIVTIEGGPTIKKIGCNSFVIYIPSEPMIDSETAASPYTWVIIKSFNGEELGRRRFFISDFPPPIPLFGNRFHGGELSYKEFNGEKTLTTIMDYQYTGYSNQCEVVSFLLIRITKDKSATIAENKGSFFQEEVAEMVQRAEPGDMYIFSDILSRCPLSMANEKWSDNLTFHIIDQ